MLLFPTSCCLMKLLREVKKAERVSHAFSKLLLHPPVCCHVMTLCCSLIGAGKQLVQYTPVQTSESDSGADLPALLELETEPFLSSDPHTEDPGITLLNHGNLDSNL